LPARTSPSLPWHNKATDVWKERCAHRQQERRPQAHRHAGTSLLSLISRALLDLQNSATEVNLCGKQDSVKNRNLLTSEERPSASSAAVDNAKAGLEGWRAGFSASQLRCTSDLKISNQLWAFVTQQPQQHINQPHSPHFTSVDTPHTPQDNSPRLEDEAATRLPFILSI